MLRITTNDSLRVLVFRIKERLEGPWVRETAERTPRCRAFRLRHEAQAGKHVMPCHTLKGSAFASFHKQKPSPKNQMSGEIS
jgi:hypothetical protein